MPNRITIGIRMKRTSIYIPEPMTDRLKAVSGKTGLSVSEMIRSAVEAYLRSLGA